MALSDATRNRLVGLLVVAVIALLARVAAVELGGPSIVGRGLYVLALVCLAGCAVIVLRERL